MTALEKFVYLYKSAEEFQKLSNWFHFAVGIMMLSIAILLFLTVFKAKRNLPAILLPIVIITSNSLLIAYGFLQHGLDNFLITVETIFTFPELYIHTIMGVVGIIGGIFEFLYIAKKTYFKLARFALPIVFIIIGYLFILHPRSGSHDENVMFMHSIYGCLLIFSGITLLLKRQMKNQFSEFLYIILSSVSLFIFAVLLFQFREPPTAYLSYFPMKQTSDATLEAKDSAIIYISQQGALPQNITIKKGGHIVFYQLDGSWHDMASGPHPTHTNYPPLNIGFLKPGQSKDVVFTNIGNFGFHDHIHENDTKLQGKIVVYQ